MPGETDRTRRVNATGRAAALARTGGAEMERGGDGVRKE